MNRLKLLSGFLVIILFTSCGRYKNIEIGEVQEFEMKGFHKDALILSVKVPISNPSLFTVKVTEMDTRVFINDQYIGKVNIADTVILMKKSEKIYDLDLQVRIANLLGSAKLMNLKKGSSVNVRIEGTIGGRVMGIRKKVKVDESRDVVL